MKKRFFGKMNNSDEVFAYTLTSDVASCEIMTKGATLLSFKTYGRDIVGGFDTLAPYIGDGSYQGATVGRVANRIANATFTMDGKEYTLPKNDGEHCLHGGEGFSSKLFEVTAYDGKSITLSYLSPSGEDGFPANLSVSVTYTLDGASLYISYLAIPDGKTPIALTNHSYFNLDGLGGTIDGHIATIYADRYTEVDETLIPNGNTPAVLGTVFDFTAPVPIGKGCSDDFIGYDHNFILSGEKNIPMYGKLLRHAASVTNGKLVLDVYTDQPGVQFYIGNFLGDGPDFKGGVPQVFHGAFCLETQTEPNCINHGVGFYDAGEVYTHNTVYSVRAL